MSGDYHSGGATILPPGADVSDDDDADELVIIPPAAAYRRNKRSHHPPKPYSYSDPSEVRISVRFAVLCCARVRIRVTVHRHCLLCTKHCLARAARESSSRDTGSRYNKQWQLRAKLEPENQRRQEGG